MTLKGKLRLREWIGCESAVYYVIENVLIKCLKYFKMKCQKLPNLWFSETFGKRASI